MDVVSDFINNLILHVFVMWDVQNCHSGRSKYRSKDGKVIDALVNKQYVSDTMDTDHLESNLYKQRVSVKKKKTNSNADSDDNNKLSTEEHRYQLRRKAALLAMKVGSSHNKSVKYGETKRSVLDDDLEDCQYTGSGISGHASAPSPPLSSSQPIDFTTNVTSFMTRPTGSSNKKKKNKHTAHHQEESDF